MTQGTVMQRHLQSCPRDAAGNVKRHRCRGPWHYIVDAGRKPDGKRKQVHRGGFSTKREAQAALDEEMARQNAGLANIHDVRVEEYLTSWLTGKRRLRETTRRGYRLHLSKYLIPALGHLRLTDLRPHHIDQLYADLIAGGYTGAGPATVHHVHRTLRSALNTAVKRRLIPWNPSLHVELPEHRRARTEVWTPQDLALFLDAIAEHRLYALFHVLAFTGLRRGEALGLHWRDADLDEAQLAVIWQVTDSGSGPQLGAPKTKAGTRLVPLDAGTVAILREHHGRQQRERAAWGSGWQDRGLVFAREDGDFVRPDSITSLFRRLCAQADVPRIRLHDLRHTHASLALSAGVDMKVVSSRLGHSTMSITADLYTHVVPAVARQAADDIASAIAAGRAPRERGVTPALPQSKIEKSGRDPPKDETAGQ